MHDQATVEINRSPAVVFPYLDQPKKLKLWMRNLISISKPPDTETHIGQKFELSFGQAGQSSITHAEIVDYQPNQHLKMHMSNPDYDTDVEFVLEPTDHGTRLTYVVDETAHGKSKLIMTLFGWLISRMEERSLDADLKKLSALIEIETKP